MSRIIAEFTLIPLGTCSTSLSQYVAKALRGLKNRGIQFKITPMSTIIEGDTLDELFEFIKIAREEVIKAGIKRLVISINIDERLDKPNRKAEDKVRSVQEKL